MTLISFQKFISSNDFKLMFLLFKRQVKIYIKVLRHLLFRKVGYIFLQVSRDFFLGNLLKVVVLDRSRIARMDRGISSLNYAFRLR